MRPIALWSTSSGFWPDMSAVRSLGVALLVAGCSSTAPSTTEFVGSFASSLGDRNSYLALQVFADGDGFLSGRAWSSFSPALIAGVTITGKKTGANLSIVIHPRPPFGLVDWRLDGTLAGDTLQGRFFFERSSAQEVHLLRVATIPLGDYSLSMTGAVQDSTIGSASFSYGGGSFRLVQVLNIPDRSLLIIRWNRRDRPPAGTYAIGGDGGTGPTVEFTYNAGPGFEDETWRIQAGHLVVQESARYVLAGRLDLNGTDPSGRAVRLTGGFSAGCTGNAC